MKTIDEIMQTLTSPSMLDDLADLIRTNDDTFSHEEDAYREAVVFLKAVLPAVAVDEYIEAYRIGLISNILYAAYEGYRANLQNFYAPCATSFPQMDFTHYIRDHLIGHFPPAVDAACIRDSFSKNLPEGCAESDEAIASYFTLLDVYGPKLAHFAGYMLANEFLPWVVPGYQADISQTLRYRSEVEKYMGFPLPV